MHSDRYGNLVTAASAEACAAYQHGVDLFLGAEAGVPDALNAAIALDPNMACAHLALARHYQSYMKRDLVAHHLAAARAAKGLSAQEQGQVHALGLLLEGRGPEAFAAIKAHLADHPRDALVAQPCIGVFGMIGFSGQPGREAEQLAFTTSLAPQFGDDWWFLAGHAFAQMEAGRTGPAEISIEKSLAQRPRSGNGAHYRSHLYYEVGEITAGYHYLRDWQADYGRSGLLHCHNGWHIALMALAEGDEAAMWEAIDRDVAPGPESGPPLNILSDMASILYRAEVAGVTVPAARWQAVSDYAARFFPNPGLAFGDVHAALAHAMAGRGDALAKIISDAKGPAADVVSSLAAGFGALAAGQWAEALATFTPIMPVHERIGGSRAQRDLIEFAYVTALLKLNQGDEARRTLAARRPVVREGFVAGLA
ncbi:MAG: tetratricopeptide repeat protein [Pikeienuella sp.]